MKKFKKLFFLLLVLLLCTIGTIDVNAARIIRDEDNDLGVVLWFFRRWKLLCRN